jgi:lipid-A-disaccharide synthase
MSRVFLSAGEASGDHYGADLLREMKQMQPATQFAFFGLCGPAMRAQGCDPVVRAEDVAHMGITEVLAHAPYIYRQFHKLKQSITTQKPALAVLIDFPDVNFRLARHCHSLGIPVLWLVSPQLWAWKKRRLRWVQRWVTKMLVIFPFEEEFYRQRKVDAQFIGHPLADLPLPTISREQFAQQNGLLLDKQWIALLPGSRRLEFALNFSTMLEAARLLGPDYTPIVPVAPTLDWNRYAQQIVTASAVPVRDARDALFHARGSIVASGTATVQAALMGNPFVIVYRMSPLSYRLARMFVTVPFAGMPNLIAGREIIPELLQDQFTAENVVKHLRPLLQDGPERDRQQWDLAALRLSLTLAFDGPSATEAALPNRTAGHENEHSSTAMARAARAALELLS